MKEGDIVSKKIENDKAKLDSGSKSMSVEKVNFLKESKQSVKSGDSV